MLYKIIKFSVVGISATVLNYGSFFLLLKILNSHYLFSSIIGYLIGVVAGFYLNKYWTFDKQVDKEKSYLIRYILVYIGSLIISQLFLMFLVEVIIINPLISNLFAIALSTVLNFIGSNYLVFDEST